MTRSMNQTYYQVDILDMAAQKLLLEEFLLKQSDTNTRDSQGRNALYWAIYHKSRHNVRLLLKYGSSLKVTPNLHALFHAIDCNDYETFAELLELGLDINMINECGQTLLMRTIKAESVQMVRYLINHGADLYLLDNNHQMAIDYAKEIDNQKVYELVHYRMVYDDLMAKECCKDCKGGSSCHT